MRRLSSHARIAATSSPHIWSMSPCRLWSSACSSDSGSAPTCSRVVTQSAASSPVWISLRASRQPSRTWARRSPVSAAVSAWRSSSAVLLPQPADVQELEERLGQQLADRVPLPGGGHRLNHPAPDGRGAGEVGTRPGRVDRPLQAGRRLAQRHCPRRRVGLGQRRPHQLRHRVHAPLR